MNLPGTVFLAGSECQDKTAAVSRPAVEAEPGSYPAGGIPDISQPYSVVVACRSGTEAGTENPAVQALGNTDAVVFDREAQSSPSVGIADDGDACFGAGMAEGIIDQVADNVRQVKGIALHDRRAEPVVDGDTRGIAPVSVAGGHFFEHGPEIESGRFCVRPPVADRAVDELRHFVGDGRKQVAAYIQFFVYFFCRPFAGILQQALFDMAAGTKRGFQVVDKNKLFFRQEMIALPSLFPPEDE